MTETWQTNNEGADSVGCFLSVVRRVPRTRRVSSWVFQVILFATCTPTKSCFVWLIQTKKLPASFSEATITFIAKKDKDPTQCSSYRPISVLNVNVKILAKIMARRLENVQSLVISTDQNSFIKNRHSYYSTCRLFSMLYSTASTIPDCVLSVYAEKSFDQFSVYKLNESLFLLPWY